jgi:hypothetical protein
MTLASFAGEKTFTADRPKAEAFSPVLNREVSTFSIPIELTAAELARILNLTVGKELYKGSTKTKGLTTDVIRNGPIIITAADNFLYITLPVAMNFSYGMFESRPIPFKLKFKASARVTSDWRLQTDISYVGISDLLAEEVGIGPLSFKPRSIVDGLTQPVQKLLSDLVAQKVNELLPLKTRIANVWSTIQKPILLEKNYKTWLLLTPRDVMLFPLYAQNNLVKLSVGISTLAEVAVGPEPATPPLKPLPNLTMVAAFDKTFKISLNTDLYYKDLRAIAAPLLLNKKFDSDGKSVVVKDFDLYGNGDKVVVKLETEGSLDGVIYLTAKPVFNPQSNIFSLEDVDFDMQTQSLLLKSADWFLHGTIRGMIQEKLNVNLTQQLEKSRETAAKALSRVTLIEHLFLKCDIKDLAFKEVIVQQDKISIQIFTNGESTVSMQ